MRVYKSVLDLVGGTPLVELTNYEKANGLEATILGKVEYFNPAGSVKDRIAKAMIDDAEAKGILKEDSVIIEPTSGNTGIGLAAVAAARGYKVILTMPETMSVERRNLLKAYGAKLVLTDGSKGMKGAIAKANELAEELPDSFRTVRHDFHTMTDRKLFPETGMGFPFPRQLVSKAFHRFGHISDSRKLIHFLIIFKNSYGIKVFIIPEKKKKIPM